MDSILSKIYDGEYTPAVEEVQNEKMQELLAKYSGMEDEISEALSGELKDKFLEYTMICASYYTECGREDFKAGFRLAVRLMLEGLGKEKVSFPG